MLAITRWGGLQRSHLEHQNRRANIWTECVRCALYGTLLAWKQPWLVQFYTVWCKPQLGSLAGISWWAVLCARCLSHSALVLAQSLDLGVGILTEHELRDQHWTVVAQKHGPKESSAQAAVTTSVYWGCWSCCSLNEEHHLLREDIYLGYPNLIGSDILFLLVVDMSPV